MADLHPVVIPPFEHTHKAIKYTCSGEGLYKDGYAYDPHAEKLIPPKSAKAGAESKELEKKPQTYWKAQCAFRGLNQSGSINDLQLRLREAKKKLLLELKIAETELNKEFKKVNKAARNDSWASHKSDEQKAKADPKRYLAEAFPKGGTGRPLNLDIVVLKLGLDERLKVSNAAGDGGLTAVAVAAPWTSSRKPSPDHWLVIGRDSKAVLDQVRQVEREASRSKQTFAGSAAKTQAPKEKAPKSSLPKASQGTTKKAESPAVKQPSKPSQMSANPRMKPPIVSSFGPTPRTKQTARKSVLPDSDSDEEPSHSWVGFEARNSAPSAAYSTVIPSHSPMVAKSSTKPPAIPSFSGVPKGLASETARKPALSSGYKTEKPQEPAGKMTDGSWDIRGSYEIQCDDIEGEWGSQGDPTLTLDLYLQNIGGKQQLYGMFQFRVIEGIMRFEKPIPVPKSEKAQENSKKRKREDVDDDGDLNMDTIPSFAEDRLPHDYSEKAFFLGTKDKPTARRPTWRYRWRGSETGEGEIQLGSDRFVQSITFTDKGNKLFGTFRCNYTGECRFTGVKVSSSAIDGRVDPEAQWTNHGEAAHEYAMKSRWGSSR